MPDLTLSVDLFLLLLILVLGLVFDFINGFHDTANAIATVVATRVLSPGRAVLMASVLNFAGALSGTAVATTVGKGIIPPELSTQSLVISALIAAIVWNLVTWYFGGAIQLEPRADLFSLVGAGRGRVQVGARSSSGASRRPLKDLLPPNSRLRPAHSLMMVLLLNLFVHAYPQTVTRFFGRAQVLSAAWMAFSHGSNDAQKTMGVMTMAVASYLHWGGTDWQVPLWIIVGAALAMGLGTSIGGWRIIRTMGLRVVQLRPIDGFAAETAAATVIEVASRLGIPVSTTHTIGSAILGVGATRRVSAVRWGIAGQIVMPGCLRFQLVSCSRGRFAA